nr:hypothetical protein [Pirellulales bacterium]
MLRILLLATVVVSGADSSADITLVAVGSHGTILRTTDGGDNWSQQPLNITRELRAVDFVDPELGWTSGMFEFQTTTTSLATMRYTLDGGLSWRDADFQTMQNNFMVNDINFFNSSTGWIVGGLGNVWCSCNGGLSWAKQYPGESSDFNGVEFVGTSRGWVVGGTIVHTADAGRTWTTQYRLSNAQSTDVDFVDEYEGWVVGTSGHGILHTTNGGATWSGQPYPGPAASL